MSARLSHRYALYVVHADQPHRGADVARAFKAECRRLRLPLRRIRVYRRVPSRIGKGTIGACFYFASRRGAASRACRSSISNALASGIPTFPVVSPSMSFSRVVPKELEPFNAIRWDGARLVAIQALRSLGLAEFQRRVFISYKQSDAWAMADQIWEALSRQGFEVFLDRIGVEPGADFQKRLYEALDEKSFILLIESPRIRESPWVEIEFNYARERNMGIAVLTWPQTTASKILPGVYEKYRMRIPRSGMRTRAADRQARLTADSVRRLVQEVEGRHAEALLRRRRELMGSLQGALRRAGVSYRGVSDWSLVADARPRAGAARVKTIISITPRAPDVPDLFSLDGSRRGYAGRRVNGVLVHTMRSMPDDRTGLLEWVVGRRSLKLVPEDRLVEFAESL